MNRIIARTKSRALVKTRERKPDRKARAVARSGSQKSLTAPINGGGHGNRKTPKQKEGPAIKREAALKASSTDARRVTTSEVSIATTTHCQPDVAASIPPSGPFSVDILARTRQSAAAVPEAKVTNIEETTAMLKRVVSRALGRGRGMDGRERKAVLAMLCDEVKALLLQYELVLEGLSFLERLRFAKTRGAVVSARLHLKGIIAGLAAVGAPTRAVEELSKRVQ